MINITNEDNMDLMSRFENDHFDLAIIDLEYGIGASKPSVKKKAVIQNNGNKLSVNQNIHAQKDWDFKMSDKNYFRELFRVSKNQIIWGGFYYGLKGGAIVWDKLNGETDQFDCEIAYQSFNKRTDLFYYKWRGMIQGKVASRDIKKAIVQQGNKKLNEKIIHPTQKPVKVCEYLILKYAEKGFNILDTHGGSMSLALAVHNINTIENMELNLDVCEIDKDYYNDGILRYKKHVSNYAPLFNK